MCKRRRYLNAAVACVLFFNKLRVCSTCSLLFFVIITLPLHTFVFEVVSQHSLCNINFSTQGR